MNWGWSKRTVTPTPALTNQALLLQLQNQYRARQRLAPLSEQALLTLCAQQHSDYQASIAELTHFGPGHATVLTRLRLLGYPYLGVIGENLAGDYATPAAVLLAWRSSAPHRQTLLNPVYTYVGVGLAYRGSGRYWTVVYGTGIASPYLEIHMTGPILRPSLYHWIHHIIH